MKTQPPLQPEASPQRDVRSLQHSAHLILSPSKPSTACETMGGSAAGPALGRRISPTSQRGCPSPPPHRPGKLLLLIWVWMGMVRRDAAQGSGQLWASLSHLPSLCPKLPQLVLPATWVTFQLPWGWFRPQLCSRPLTPPKSLDQPLLAQGSGHTSHMRFGAHTLLPCLPGTLLPEVSPCLSVLFTSIPTKASLCPQVLKTVLAWAGGREQHGWTHPPDLGSIPMGSRPAPCKAITTASSHPQPPWTQPVCLWLSPGLSAGVARAVPRLHLRPTKSELPGSSHMRPSPVSPPHIAPPSSLPPLPTSELTVSLPDQQGLPASVPTSSGPSSPHPSKPLSCLHSLWLPQPSRVKPSSHSAPPEAWRGLWTA